ncbi:MAG: hypothetical protein IPG96_08590 [Proteobacteria bacterium]|nr:hypothetical protein [Pseudomonadota bacterium]
MLAEKTPAGELWRFLSRWAQGGHARHSAVERAVTQMLCFCDEQWEGRQQAEEVPRGSPVHAWPLTLWCAAAASQDLRRPTVDALLILSARWPEQPLENVPLRLIVAGGAVELSFRQVFTEALALLADRRPGIVERAGRWEIPIARSPGGPVAVHVPIPPEALLLRAPPALVPLIAETLAFNVGVHDGRLVALLAELRQRPEDDKLRGRFARAAAAASWRLVRDDPRWITAWGLQQRGPRTLAELRALLSEPAPLGAQSATEALQARVQAQGSWAARTDVQRLARLASEVPGDLTMAPLPWRLEQDVFATEIEQAIQRLEHAAEQPVARLMGDIVFLRSRPRDSRR